MLLGQPSFTSGKTNRPKFFCNKLSAGWSSQLGHTGAQFAWCPALNQNPAIFLKHRKITNCKLRILFGFVF